MFILSPVVCAALHARSSVGLLLLPEKNQNESRDVTQPRYPAKQDEERGPPAQRNPAPKIGRSSS